MTEVDTHPDTLLNAVLITSPDAIAIFEPTGNGSDTTPDLRPTRTNRAALDLPPELWTILRDHCRRAARNGSPSTAEMPHQTGNGERWLRLNAVPSGDLVVATVADVTALHDARREMAETRREAERQREETMDAGEAKSSFLATIRSSCSGLGTLPNASPIHSIMVADPLRPIEPATSAPMRHALSRAR